MKPPQAEQKILIGRSTLRHMREMAGFSAAWFTAVVLADLFLPYNSPVNYFLLAVAPLASLTCLFYLGKFDLMLRNLKKQKGKRSPEG